MFVGGPFGPFFRELANRLKVDGGYVTKICVNGADVWDWGLRDARLFTGSAKTWPAWIARVLESGATDLVTYGDQQFYAREAIAAARKARIAVHIFEQGYFRPNWLTLEDSGVNGSSSLPRDPDYYRAKGRPHREIEHTPLGKITPGAVRAAFFAHWCGQYPLKPLFWRQFYPYHYNSWRQGFGHIGRYLAGRLNERRNQRRITAMIEQPEPIYLALLQKPGDSQLTQHSPFPDASSFIDEVLTSFAAHAPPDSILAFKAHPLDHGLERYDLHLWRRARALGVENRVVLLEKGHLATLVRAAAGVLTVNSTAGLTALHFRRPTIALGSAIYNMPGLTHQAGLDTFWKGATAPDHDLFLRFRDVVMTTTQVNGGYTTALARALAVRAAAQKMAARPVLVSVNEAPARAAARGWEVKTAAQIS